MKKYLSIFVMFLFMLMAFPLSAIAWEEDELVIPESTKTHTAHPGAGFFYLDANRILTFMDENGNTQVIFGSGSTTFGTVDINGGSIDGTAIGAANPSTGVFSSLQANETLGGVSTYGISGNMTLNDPLYLSGRPGALLASSSPILTLPTLSGVSPIVILQDTTTAGNDSGVTVFSPTQQIYSGVGSTAVAGSTIFVNSGNTRFNMTLKAMPVTGGTLSWFVYSFNGNTLRRP